MNYYIISGEASGDLHASNLIAALKAVDSNASFTGWGGDRMAAQGVPLVHHIRELSYMGFWEVATHLPAILSLLREAKRDVVARKPDLLILVDYPAFNLPVAKTAAAAGIPVCWYISPQVWAWKANRVKKLRKRVDQMLVILPFEPAFYEQRDFKVEYVGHPLLDALPRNLESNQAKHVALLPGSRAQELKRMLPVMLETAAKFPDQSFVVAGVSAQAKELYTGVARVPNVKLVFDQTTEVLGQAKAALVTSGTATLETALMRVPQVVCYRGNPLSFWLARRLVDVPFISLVNLIADRELVPELIQQELNVQNLSLRLESLLKEGPERQNMLSGYAELHEKLGGPGASGRAAEKIWQRFGSSVSS